MGEITLFPKTTTTTPSGHMELSEFLEKIGNGEWKEEIQSVRKVFSKNGRGSTEYKDSKKQLPCVTISGKFTKRNLKSFVSHSGYVCVDIDKIEDGDFEKAKELLKKDKHVYSVFFSVSGKGLAVVFKIKPKEHKEIFIDIQEYFKQKYKIEIDWLIDISRLRYVSYDPELFLNEKSKIFTLGIVKHPPKENTKTSEIPTYKVELNGHLEGEFSDDEQLSFAESIVKTRYNFIEGQRHNYIFNLACIANRLGVKEDVFTSYVRREYPHFASNPSNAIRQPYRTYRNEHGAWKKPKIIGVRKPQLNGTNPTVTEDGEVIEVSGHTRKGKHLAALQQYLIEQFEIRRNEITRLVELNGVSLDDSFLNGIWFDCHSIGINVARDDVKAVLESPIFKSYHPIKEFLEAQTFDPNGKSMIYEVARSVKTPTYEMSQWLHLLKKWMVGAVANIYDDVKSPLMLVFYGAQSIGKTYFFRNLLPQELVEYFAENSLDKDEEQILSSNMIVYDDEFSGKSKRDYKKLKEMLSKKEFTLRLPYAKMPCTLPRMATLAGASNEDEIIFDPTGNRRVIPVEVTRRDTALFDSVDKAKLWREAYYLYQQGFDYELSPEDIKNMNERTEKFEVYTAEYECIMEYLENPFAKLKANESIHSVDHELMSATEILAYLLFETPNTRLNKAQLGRELKRLGFGQMVKKIDGKAKRVYYVRKRNGLQIKPF